MPFSETEKEPLVSIIIPCYNQGEFLHDALSSIEKNGYSPVEIIVIDDASTDPETPRIIDELRRTGYPATFVTLPVNRGLSCVRNTGIRMAKGEYIICLDADDMLHLGCITTYLSMLAEHPDAGFVYGNYQCFGDTDFYMKLEEFSQAKLIRGKLPISPASMYRKTTWEKIGGYDENRELFVEDWEFWLRLSKAGLYGVYKDFTAIDYRKHSVRKNGISRYEEATKNSLKTTWYSFKKHKDPRIFLHGWHITLDRIMMSLIVFTKKIQLYRYISPLWRKYILRMPPGK